jgi:hypothetical protein
VSKQDITISKALEFGLNVNWKNKAVDSVLAVHSRLEQYCDDIGHAENQAGMSASMDRMSSFYNGLCEGQILNFADLLSLYLVV